MNCSLEFILTNTCQMDLPEKGGVCYYSLKDSSSDPEIERLPRSTEPFSENDA